MVVETGAGAGARFADADYTAAGAMIAPDAGAALADADIVLKVRSPDAGEIAKMKKGAVLAALLAPYTEKDAIGKLAAQGVIGLRHGIHAAHLARAGDGRAVQPGQSRRLQGRDRCGGAPSAAPCR